jgi:hypothetical protein
VLTSIKVYGYGTIGIRMQEKRYTDIGGEVYGYGKKFRKVYKYGAVEK